MLVKFFMAIVQGYHPLLDRWPLGGQTAKLGVFFAAQHLGSPNHQKVSPEMGEEQLQWFCTICWWFFPHCGLTFLNNNNRSPTRQWHSRVFFVGDGSVWYFIEHEYELPQVEVLGRLKLVIFQCHGTASRPICLQSWAPWQRLRLHPGRRSGRTDHHHGGGAWDACDASEGCLY